MTVVFQGNGLYKGLYSDTKPTAPVGYRFEETDTGDILISDGTYWWLASQPSTLSRRRFGGMPWGATAATGVGLFNVLTPATGIGSVTFVNSDTTNGRYANMPTLTTTGNRAGYRYNSSTLFNRAQNVRMRARFMLPASTDYTLARLYIGFSSNTELTTDDPLTTNNGVMVGFLSGGTHFKVFHNDAGVTADYASDPAGSAQALDTAIHEVRIVADEPNSRFSVKWDNNAYVHFTTDIPASTSILTGNWQNETNESGVAKTFRLYSYRVETG